MVGQAIEQRTRKADRPTHETGHRWHEDGKTFGGELYVTCGHLTENLVGDVGFEPTTR